NLSNVDEHSEHLYNIKGMVPSATEFPQGCHFNPRCEFATETCRDQHPDLEEVENSNNHYTRCWEVNKLKEDS
ncbi:MAG: oligopeptide/dipeptide ABC transporter ATP-binding protein, partial [Fidelibacterota bacterium]